MNAPLRPVTILVSDLKGSTALAERFDAETLRLVLTRYFDAMTAVIEGHAGTVVKIIGDAVVATFDEAGDAATAALESAVVLSSLNERFAATWGVTLENRTGLASGSVADDEGTVLTGEVVRVAESLEAAAPVGAALIDDATHALMGGATATEPFGAVPRKGSADTVHAWRLVPVEGSDRERARTADVVSCPRCGADNGRDERRCAECGAALHEAVAAENRRTVTIVFADPRLSGPDGGAVDDDVTRAVMARYFDVVAPVIERHGGTVEKFIGDALMAVFGLEVRHEDDAVRAVRAAADIQSAVAILNEELAVETGVRFAHPIGVNTGAVVAGDATTGQRLVTGDAVNVAARSRTDRCRRRGRPRRRHRAPRRQCGRARAAPAVAAQGQERAGAGLPARSYRGLGGDSSPRASDDRS